MALTAYKHEWFGGVSWDPRPIQCAVHVQTTYEPLISAEKRERCCAAEVMAEFCDVTCVETRAWEMRHEFVSKCTVGQSIEDENCVIDASLNSEIDESVVFSIPERAVDLCR